MDYFEKFVRDKFSELIKCHSDILIKLENFENSENCDTELYLKLISEEFILKVKIECLHDLLQRYSFFKFEVRFK